MVDALCNRSLPRREIARSLKETLQAMASLPVGRDYLDVVAQHHIARGLTVRHLPSPTLVEIAEATGSADWKDRGLDVAVETERLFVGLAASAAGGAAITSSLQRCGAWLAQDPMMQSWFEDDAEIRALVGGTSRPQRTVAVRRMLDDVLPARREAWAERALLLALWLRADTGDAMPAERWQDCVVLAHELLAGRLLAELSICFNDCIFALSTALNAV